MNINMGVSSSSNTIKSMIDASISVINDYETQCTSTAGQAKIVFEANDCNITDNTFKANNTQAISQNCITNVTTKSSIQSNVKQALQQQAQSVTQQFSFPSASIAQNFIDQSEIVANNISNHYVNNCIGEGLTSTIKISCSGSTLSNNVFDFNNYQTLAQSCIANFVTDNAAVQKLESILSQSATAKQEATFAYFIFAFVAVLAVVAWAGISIAKTPLVQWAIVGLILFSVISAVVYALTAKNRGNYPYTKY